MSGRRSGGLVLSAHGVLGQSRLVPAESRHSTEPEHPLRSSIQSFRQRFGLFKFSGEPMRGSGILVEAGDMPRVAQVMFGIWFGCANLLEQVLIEPRSLIDKRAAVLTVSQ